MALREGGLIHGCIHDCIYNVLDIYVLYMYYICTIYKDSGNVEMYVSLTLDRTTPNTSAHPLALPEMLGKTEHLPPSDILSMMRRTLRARQSHNRTPHRQPAS